MIQSDGRSADEYRLHREKIAFRPARQVVRSDLPTPTRLIQILQSPDTYQNSVCDLVRGGAVSLEPRANIDDPLVSRIALTVAKEIGDGFRADALNTALAVQIIRQFADPSAINLAPSNGLTRERLKRVCDYIEAHLDARLTLTDIAGVACLSPYHFSRSFKQAVGVGPHRYVFERRIARAKTLRRTRQPLALIAQEIGLADQSHLISIFRREIGMTPGRYRATVARGSAAAARVATAVYSRSNFNTTSTDLLSTARPLVHSQSTPAGHRLVEIREAYQLRRIIREGSA